MTALPEYPGSRSAAAILLVGDRGSFLTDTARAVSTLGDVSVATLGDAAMTFRQLFPDVVVIDESDGDPRARQLLAEVARIRPEAVRVLLAAASGAGETDGTTVVPKPVEPGVLHAVCAIARDCAVARGMARGVRRGESSTLHEIGDMERYEGILTRSPAMKRVVGLLRKLEGNDISVVIHGETGTGKELVAQAIHARSRSRGGRFVAVNLGALADHLRETELFGDAETPGGLFVEANGGCLFLDEIGDASPALQVALLRALEDGTITPVGADRPRRVDVRVISGTSRDLEELVRQGLFRRDLYHRLNVFPIVLPPLRERAEDVFPLARHFLAQASITMGKRAPGISREARAVLESHEWEGNVRELRNIMERAAILCKGGLVIAADLPLAPERRAPVASATGGAWTIAIPPGGAKLQQLEREIFLKTLSLAGDNQSRAARILGLRESTFRFRLQKLGIASRRAASVRLGRVAAYLAATIHHVAVFAQLLS